MADEMGTRQQTISEWEKEMYRPRGASSTLLTIIAERADFRYDFRDDYKSNTCGV
jgi:DNA-binding transcriptional regulator YiaG